MVIFINSESCPDRINALVESYELTAVKDINQIEQGSLYLEYNDEGLSLNQDSLSLMADFRDVLPRMKASNLNNNEMLVKAVRIKDEKNITVLDATAGFGEDDMILAGAGCNVEMFEYDPIIAALLEDAMERATMLQGLAGPVSRMSLHKEDSIVAMQAGELKVDVVYLDPMFPERQKSGLIKKKFQMLQQLQSPCSDENDLLEAAKSLKPRKIVIKRPLKGPNLGNIKPSYSVNGKAIRYDVILLN